MSHPYSRPDLPDDLIADWIINADSRFDQLTKREWLASRLLEKMLTQNVTYGDGGADLAKRAVEITDHFLKTVTISSYEHRKAA